jgi:hypothetical protein
MVKKVEHLNQATWNHEVIISLGERKSKYLDWVITVVFYEAIHYVESAFACIHDVGHTERCQKVDESPSGARWRLVKKVFNRNVQQSFWELETASKNLRYLLGDYQSYYDEAVVAGFIDSNLALIKTESINKHI